MKKRKTVFLLFLTIILFIISTVGAAVAETTPEPAWNCIMDDGLPILINRFEDQNAWPEFDFDPDADLLEIWFPNVRNSDCTIIRHAGQVWMIDTADVSPAMSRVIPLMQKLGITRIDKLINTHPHHDHLNGFFKIADAADVGELTVCFPEDYNDHIKSAVKSAALRNIPVTHYANGDHMQMGQAEFDIWQIEDETYNENSRSAVIRMTYGERSVLFTADIEIAAEKKLMEMIPADALNTDVLKYPHHGKEVMYEPFYTAVDPVLVVIFNNAITGDSPYYLGCKHVPVVHTVSAYVHLVTDGHHWLLERITDPAKMK